MFNQELGYIPTNTMRDILRDNSLLVKTVGRFGIAFGFGDETVQNVCEANNVDTTTFLSVCNLLSGYKYRQHGISLKSLMFYLKRAHAYFMDFTLPQIRRELIDAINHSSEGEVPILLMKFYDEYVAEVKNHMDHENNHIFGYIDSLLDNKIESEFRISQYSESHDLAIEKLKDLKDIFIYHFKQEDNQKLSSTLFDIVMCEKDMTAHFEIENRLLIPVAQRLEEQLLESQDYNAAVMQPEDKEILSEREKEIIRLVAKGLSNKEIGDKLNISMHTVATHRRNINAKLEIHSPAALTIYAVINGLIDINEISQIN